MGLHFHGHGVKHYKEQGREEVRVTDAKVDPIDTLNASIERHILKEDAKAHANEAQRNLSHAAEHFKEALINYKDALKNKVTGHTVATPKPKP